MREEREVSGLSPRFPPWACKSVACKDHWKAFTSGWDEIAGTRFTFLPPETIFLSDKIYETVVLWHWHQATKDSDLWKVRSKCSWARWLSQLTAVRVSTLRCREGESGQRLADSLSWRLRAKSLEDPNSRRSQERVVERWKLHRSSGELQRVLLESSAEYQSVHSCKETTWGWREDHPKGLGARVAGTTGQYKRLRLPATLTKSHDSQNSEEFCLSSSEYNCQNFPDDTLQVCAVHHIWITSHQNFLNF